LTTFGPSSPDGLLLASIFCLTFFSNHTQPLAILPRRLLTLVITFRIVHEPEKIQVITIVPHLLATIQISFQPVRRPIPLYLAFLNSYLK
jgi:hypothetical protein